MRGQKDETPAYDRHEDVRKKLKDLALGVAALLMDSDSELGEHLANARRELEAAYRAHVKER